MTPITFGSVCSGIEAASVAWGPLGWKAAWLSEIEPFPCAVLAHHYPDVPNLGDMTTLVRRILCGEVAAPDVFTGGTPCQAFSVAGKRRSLDDARGNLSLTFVDIADAIDHIRSARGDDECVVVWENVPGVLSTRDNAFGCFLGALAGSGCELRPPGGGAKWDDAGCVYGPARTIAWRVLDAQYFGLAQRRRRVFVVASARDGFDPVAVLFEREGLRRDTPPSRAAREIAPTIPSRSTAGGGLGTDFDLDGGVGVWPADIACTLNASFGDKQGLEDQHINGGGRCLSLPPVSMCLNAGAMGRQDAESETLIPTFGGGFDVTHSLRAEGFDASEDGTGRGTPIAPVAPVAYRTAGDGAVYEEGNATAPLTTGTDPSTNIVAFSCEDHGADAGDLSPTLRAMGHSGGHPNGGGQVAIAIRTAQTGSNGWGVNTDGVGYTLDGAQQAVAIALRGREGGATAEVGDEVGHTLRASSGGGDKPHVMTGMAVRRLTPRECERLQGFPDDYTLIPWRAWREANRKGVSYEVLLIKRGMRLRGPSIEECPDSPRYKAIGNSWAVPCVRWIGARVDAQLRGLT